MAQPGSRPLLVVADARSLAQPEAAANAAAQPKAFVNRSVFFSAFGGIPAAAAFVTSAIVAYVAVQASLSA
jgi:hypothetical protein